MNKQNVVIAWMIGMPCAVILFGILMACLREYQVVVGASLLLLTFGVVGVHIRGVLIEQNLRIFRFDHKRETPLDMTGEPKFWREGMKENPYRQPSQPPYTTPAYQEQERRYY